MLSAFYGRLAARRRAWYDRRPHLQRRLEHPVISVGNLVVGGSGKTPVVAALARLLREAGERPAILSRGYARRDSDEGVVVVSDGERVLEAVERSGDEPQMLARSLPGVPVLVSSDRWLAGQLAERRFGATVTLLDDGFQHLQLARDVDLLLVSAADLEQRPLPSGRLREPLASARAADALVVFGSLEDAARVSAALGVDVAFNASVRYDGLRQVGVGRDSTSRPEDISAAPDPRSPIPDRRSRAVVAVSGIARPARFFDALRAQGWEVRREMVFPDHHWYTLRDLDAVASAARGLNVDLIVTTEKDAVRLGATELAGSASTWAYLPLAVTIEPSDRFDAWLLGRLKAAPTTVQSGGRLD